MNSLVSQSFDESVLEGKQAEHHKNRYSHKEELEPDVNGAISEITARKIVIRAQDSFGQESSGNERGLSAEIEKPRVVGVNRKTVREGK